MLELMIRYHVGRLGKVRTNLGPGTWNLGINSPIGLSLIIPSVNSPVLNNRMTIALRMGLTNDGETISPVMRRQKKLYVQ